ncbi:COQ9 family protein [Algicella marina]|uniref:COQ9 family protein n=1 Tax=Algicella marina TaxID=2683284 RepID=A0A6P1SVI0_9RHOB|nr:COQ9 family protein [Algicella marina]QHQ33777.1 COQ9 family protein [Algicella marina]
MAEKTMSEAEHIAEVRAKVLEAALPLVVFDGWSDHTLAEAVRDSGAEPGISRLAFPRGGVDLALAFHARGDAEMSERLAQEDLSHLRYSERVARAIEMRLEQVAQHKEAVRRGAALFALPVYAADGGRAVWQTADTIWKGLGDSSDDYNWYTKRLTLSAVYSSVVLYWLGDESEDGQATRDFIQRRIENVMQFEKFKSSVRSSPVGRILEAGPGRILDHLRPPGAVREDLPGWWPKRS